MRVGSAKLVASVLTDEQASVLKQGYPVRVVVTTSTIATETCCWSRAAQLATNTRRVSGRSLFAGLTISTLE
jgi:hypothetical protein